MRLFAQMLAKRIRVDLNALPRIAQKTLLPQVIHLERDDLAGRADVLGNHLVRERRDLDGPVIGARSQPVGEAQKRAHYAFRGLIEGEALQPVLIIQPALDQHLQQRDAEARLAFDLFLDFLSRPGHQGNGVEGDSALVVVGFSQQRVLTEEVVCGEDVDYGLRAVVQRNGDLDPTLYYEMKAFGRMMFIEYDLRLTEVGDCPARKIHEGIFHLAGLHKFNAVRHVETPLQIRFVGGRRAC